MTRNYALLAVGELLGDFIGTEISTNLRDTEIFRRFQGGSPSNLAANMARLGEKTAIVSCVGEDNLGTYLVDEVAKTGVDVSHVQRIANEPSSIVLVSRTEGTPDFIPYRTSDRMIRPEHISDELLNQCAIFHTTCWPLSKEPSQSTVLDAAKRAKKAGCIISADLNYAERVWPYRQEAHEVIKAYLSNGALIKLSEDDAERFYGEPVSIDKVLTDFHAWGAELICFTLGSKGSLVSTNGGKTHIETKGRPIEVVDATGAGDSFWAGFLTAYLEGHDPKTCANAGTNLAALKLMTLGPLPKVVDRQVLYQN
jgi:sugar/nucleoside kinase (ribokinase family)